MRESAIDSLLVQYAGIKTPNDIADMTGLAPEDVVRRTQEILDRVTLTSHQIYAKAMFQLQEIISDQRDAVKGAAPEDVARVGNTAAGAIGRMVKLTQDLEAMANKDASEQKEVMGRVLANLVDKAMQRAIGELKQRHPEIETEQLGGILETHLIEIAAEMDSE